MEPDVSGRDASPYAAQANRLSRLRQIYQAIVCEEHCPRDGTAQEDYIFDRLCELTEGNGITAEEAQDSFNLYRLYANPEPARHLGQVVARPFYE